MEKLRENATLLQCELENGRAKLADLLAKETVKLFADRARYLENTRYIKFESSIRISEGRDSSGGQIYLVDEFRPYDRSRNTGLAGLQGLPR